MRNALRKHTSMLVATLALAGCVGQIGPLSDRVGDGGGGGVLGPDGAVIGGPDGASVYVASCDDPDPGTAVPLPRLSRAEYVNTVRDVLLAGLPAARSTAGIHVLTGETTLGAWGNQLPDDQRISVPNAKHGGYRNLDQDVESAFMQGTYNLAIDVSSAVITNASDVASVLGSCAGTSGSPPLSCLESFIARFGALAFRHPLSTDDVTFYAGLVHNSTAPADVADLIALLMTAPEFLYHVEHGDQNLRADLYALDPYELAARLSYHFWQTIPDAALTAAAASGALSTPDGLRAQVNRLVADPRAAATTGSFFQQYLWLDEVSPLNVHVTDHNYITFEGSITPTATLNTEMAREVVDSAQYTVAHGGTLADFINDRHAYARTPTLAAIYGTSVWDGMATPPIFTDSARVGLITRAAFLVNSTIGTRPIMKGVFLREGLLCDDIPPPPNNASSTPLPNIPMGTTRQQIEALTMNAPCNGCHDLLINDLGFATENFDALGRTRTVQSFYDGTTGAVTGSTPIDTHSTPRITADDTHTSSGAGDVTRLMLTSPSNKVQTCFARQYFRFTFTRVEDLTHDLTDTTHNADACLITAATSALTSGGTLNDVMALYALRPEFARRHFAQ